MLHPQGIFYPQQGYPQQGPFQGYGYSQQAPFQSYSGSIPFANTLYGYPQLNGYPQQTPSFTPGVPQWTQLQHPAAQQQAALHQQAIQQLIAHQLATQQLAAQQPSAVPAFTGFSNGISNGAAQGIGEQFSPVMTRHPLLQQLAQYHYLVAQQLAQLAAQQAVQLQGAGQFVPGQLGFIPGQLGVVPGQLGGNFVSGITMH